MNLEYNKTKNNIRTTVVCVTNQFQCERLITVGKAIAQRTGTALRVINVISENPVYGNNPEALEFLYEKAKENGAEMSILYAEDVAKSTIRYLKDNHAFYVITGTPGEDNSVLYPIWSRFTHIQFFMVDVNGQIELVNTRELMLSQKR